MPSNEQRRDNAKRKLERQLVRRAERARRRKLLAVGGTVAGVVVVAAAVFLFGFSGIFSDEQAADQAAADQQQQSSAPQGEVDKPQNIPAKAIALPERSKPLPATVDCKYPKSPEPAAKPAKKPSGDGVSTSGKVKDKLRTTAGELTLTLDRSLAPCAVHSFVNLTEQGYFDNTPCHRLTVSGLQVLQCGDPSGSGSGGPGYSFADETFPEIKYGRGVLAMANSGPDTNGSQFFIVYGEAELPPNYTVFGSIDAESLKRVDDLAKIGTVRGTDPASGQPTPGDGKPKKEMRIQKASIVA